MSEDFEKFVSWEMSTISRIYYNDHWFCWSWILAKRYLKAARQRVSEVKNPVSRRKLLWTINKINKDCDYLLWYHNNIEAFKDTKTEWFIKKIAKKIFILLHLWNMNIVHSWISHQLRYFHSTICDLLIPQDLNGSLERSFLKQKLEKK